jgi:hypothetical protein
MFTANIIINFFIMKKQFLNLGKALNKAEQQKINGGYDPAVCNGSNCTSDDDCIGACECLFSHQDKPKTCS